MNSLIEMLTYNPLISVVVSAIFLLFIEIFYSYYLKGKLKKRSFYIFNWKFPLNKPFTLFCLPLLIIFSFEFFILFPKINLVNLIETLSWFLQPLFEEIVFRGMILGAILKKYSKSRIKWDLKLSILLIIQSFIFLVFHIFTTKNPIGVFSTGIIYGILFILTKNDVTLPTITHIAGNILLIFS